MDRNRWWEKQFAQLKSKSKVPIDKFVAKLRRTSSNTSLSSLESYCSDLKSPRHQLDFSVTDALDRENPGLSFEEYCAFWQTLEDPEIGVYFIAACIRTLLKTNPKYANPLQLDEIDVTKPLPEDKHFHICLLNTIHFLDLFYNVSENDTSTDLLMVMEELETNERRKVSDTRSIASDILTNTQRTRSNSGDIILQTLTESCTLPARCHYSVWFTTDGAPETASSFKSSSTSSLSSCSSQTQLKKGYFHGNSPFYYLHLQQLLYGQIRVEKIFDELLELIQHALMALYVLPQLSQNKLLALLYMLEEFMIISPIRNYHWLEQAKNILQQIDCVPLRLETCIQDCLSNFRREITSPGHLYRERLLSHSLWANVNETTNDNQNDSDDVELYPLCFTVLVNSQDGQFSQMKRMVEDMKPMSHAHSIRYGENKATIVSRPDTTVSFESSFLENQIEFILDSIQVDFGLNSKHIGTFKLQLRTAEPEYVRQVFEQVYQVHRAAKEVREQVLGTILTSVLGWKDVIPIRCAEYTSNTAKKRKIYHPKLKIVQDNSISSCQPLSCPALPMKISVMSQRQMPAIDSLITFYEAMPGTSRVISPFFIYCIQDFLEIKDICDAHMSASNLIDSRASVDFPITCIGSDSTVHRLLCAFVALQRYNLILGHVLASDSNIFILPDGSNNISHYFAKHDSWYRRHVYSPFVRPLPLVPALDESMEASAIHPEAQALPDNCRKSLLQNYILSAKQTCQFCVFACEVWEPGMPRATSPSFVIPFCVRIDIGILANAIKYSTAHDQPRSLSKILQDRNFVAFERVTPRLVVRYQKVSFDNLVNKFFTESPTSLFSNLSICSVPSTTLGIENGVYAQPDEPYVELDMRASRELDTRRSKTQRDAAMMRDYLSHGSKDESIKSETVDICVSNTDDSFHMAIDGELFGPFSRCRISPLHDQQGGCVRFPVKHYFPFDQ